MSLTARTRSGETICSLNFGCATEFNKKYPHGTLLSPYCDAPVFYRSRIGFPPHFVHHAEMLTGYKTDPYSAIHDMGKLTLANHFEEIYEEPIQYEVPIGNRIVDVVCGIDSIQVVGEVQVSPITIDQIEERSSNIMAMGFNPIWMLRGPANTEANRIWCDRNLCSFHVAVFELSN